MNGARLADPAAPAAFLFDPNRCTGCAACSLACSTENGLAWGRSWRQIVPFNPERRPDIPAFHLSLACNHCAQAPCIAHCPTGAMTRDPRTGAVVVDEARCIGCRYCAWVCPYDAPRFDEERGVMTKCTLCNHRLLEGVGPACVEACPTVALGYGVPEAPVCLPEIPGFPHTSAAPRIAFRALRRGGGPPPSTWTLPEEVAAACGPVRDAPVGKPPGGRLGTTREPGAIPGPWSPNRISFRAELPLLAFTSGAAALVGWVMAGVLGGSAVHPLAFSVVAAATLLVSTFHLARPARAWRAAANVRNSHLSREIVGYGAFLGCAVAWTVARLVTTAGHDTGVLSAMAAAATPALGWGAFVLGVLALFLVDRVYDPVRTPGGRPLHAGDTVLMGPLLGAAIAQAVTIFAALAMVKVILNLRLARGPGRNDRTDPLAGVGPRPHSAGLAIAAGAGLALPLMLWTVSPAAWPGWALLAAAVGTVADRARLYLALRIPTP